MLSGAEGNARYPSTPTSPVDVSRHSAARPDAARLRNKYYLEYNPSAMRELPRLVPTMAGAVALEVVTTPERRLQALAMPSFLAHRGFRIIATGYQ